MDAKDYVVQALKDGTLEMSCEDPDAPQNWPRNMFVWRSNLLGSSGKGHEYFCKHLLGTENGVQGKDLGQDDAKPAEVKWHKNAPQGKLDLLVTLDFRMSTTCLYSDIVLPTASWYEKNDLNTSDMHPFIHPLSAAVDPVWQSRSDWEIYKGFAKAFSEVCVGHLGVEKEVVLTPLMHDTPGELAQPFEVKEWKKGHCELIPGKTAPQIAVVERDYPNVFKRFTALGPLHGQGRQRRQGHRLENRHRSRAAGPAQRQDAGRGRDAGHAAHRDRHRRLRGDSAAGARDQRPCGGEGLGSAGQADRARPHPPGDLPRRREDPLPRHPGAAAQDHQLADLERHRERDGQLQRRLHQRARTTSHGAPSPVASSSTRTTPGCIAFGEGFSSYRPPVDLKTTSGIHNIKPNGNKEIQLNFITPHQKWGIHSTYSDNLMMLTLNRGGTVIWLSEDDAKPAPASWTTTGSSCSTSTAPWRRRAVVSQRVNHGMVMMYHSQEKIINTPGSEITGVRGGIHNSVTRIVLKPTHMIGGYAQLSYGFNYYGTIGTNRDEFVVVRKMDKVDWLDTPADDHLVRAYQSQGENP